MALDPKDAQLWIAVAQAAIPVVGQAVGGIAQGILAVVRLVRRSRGEPEQQDGDEQMADLIAAQVVAAIDKAKIPWATIGDVARAELERLRRLPPQ